MRKEKMKSYLLWRPVVVSHVLALLQVVQDLLDRRLFLLELLHLQRLTTALRLLQDVLVRLLHKLDILNSQLFADDVQVSYWVDIALDVDDLGIVEASYDLEDGIDGSDMRQESVAQTSTGRCASRQASNVVDGHMCGHFRLWLVLLVEPVIPLIRHDDTRLFGIDGGIWEVLAVCELLLVNEVAKQHTAGLPNEHFVMAWNSVDLPTFARPT